MNKIKGYVEYIKLETLQWNDESNQWIDKSITFSELKQGDYIKTLNLSTGRIQFVKAFVMSDDYEGIVYHLYYKDREIISYIYGQNLLYSAYIRKNNHPYLEEREFEKFKDLQLKNGKIVEWSFSRLNGSLFTRGFDNSIKDIDKFVENYNQYVKFYIGPIGNKNEFYTVTENYKGKIYNLSLPKDYVFISKNTLMTGLHE